MNKVISLVSVFTMGFALSAYATDVCVDEMGHQGDKRTIQENKIETVKGSAGTPAIDYEAWLQDGKGSLTYWTNGTFAAEWNGSNDFIVRVGLKYDDAKTYDKFGNFSADFKFTKSGNAGYSYIGVYGRMENPAVEYYIADDWFSKPAAENLGTKIDEYELDGGKSLPWEANSRLDIVSHFRYYPRKDSIVSVILTHHAAWHRPLYYYAIKPTSNGASGTRELKDYRKFTDLYRTDVRVNLDALKLAVSADLDLIHLRYVMLIMHHVPDDAKPSVLQLFGASSGNAKVHYRVNTEAVDHTLGSCCRKNLSGSAVYCVHRVSSCVIDRGFE